MNNNKDDLGKFDKADILSIFFWQIIIINSLSTAQSALQLSKKKKIYSTWGKPTIRDVLQVCNIGRPADQS